MIECRKLVSVENVLFDQLLWIDHLLHTLKFHEFFTNLLREELRALAYLVRVFWVLLRIVTALSPRLLNSPPLGHLQYLIDVVATIKLISRLQSINLSQDMYCLRSVLVINLEGEPDQIIDDAVPLHRWSWYRSSRPINVQTTNILFGLLMRAGLEGVLI